MLILKILSYLVYASMVFHVTFGIYTRIRKINSIPTVIGQRKRLGETLEEFNSRAWREKWPILIQTLYLLGIIILAHMEVIVALPNFGIDLDETTIREILSFVYWSLCSIVLFFITVILILRKDDAVIS